MLGSAVLMTPLTVSFCAVMVTDPSPSICMRLSPSTKTVRGQDRGDVLLIALLLSMAEGLIGVEVDVAGVPPQPGGQGQRDHGDQGQPAHGSAGFSGVIGGELRSALGADQLGPDAKPVVRAQVPAADGAACGLLNWHATRDWHGPDAVAPLVHG